MSAHAADDGDVVDHKAEAIVKAARAAFLAHGFDGASMDQIALSAGVSKRTVYNRFRSKEALFGAAIEESCRHLLPVNVEEIEASLPPEEVILVLCRRFVEGILEPDALALRRIASFEAGRAPEIGRSYLQHGPQWMVEQCAPIVARLAAKGVVKVDDPRAALWRLGALITEPLHTRLLLGAEPDDLAEAIELQVREGVDAFLKIYAPD
ncbi:MAG: TetR/AcrR family transcriptional regulator [Hyphococcus sp.]